VAAERPYADAHADYIERGWFYPIPLGSARQRARKAPPPEDVTGHGHPEPSENQIEGWARTHAVNNIGLRLPDFIVGIDVDDYGDKSGATQLAELEHELGKLPPAPRSTARGADNPSGIRFFTVPAGTRLKGQAAKDIEIIQNGHRYAVVWPSVHPEGGTYLWYDRRGKVIPIPRADKLRELPAGWLARFARDAPAPGSSAARLDEVADYTDLSSEQVKDWLARYAGGRMCRAVKATMRVAENALDDTEGARTASHYDTARDAVYALVNFAVEGHLGVRNALRIVGEAYSDYIATKPERDRSEWARMVDGAVSKAAAITADDWSAHEEGLCPDREGIDSETIWASPTDPAAVARRWLSENYPETDSVFTLRHWRGDFYRYDTTRWVPISEATISAALWRAMENASYWSAAAAPVLLGWHPTPQKITGVTKAIAALVHTPDEVEPDLDGAVSVANGTVDLATRNLKNHSPARFNLTSLPFPYDEHAPAPKRWLRFLGEVIDDDESIALLAEWFGYVISGNTDVQRLMFIFGPPRSGKGTIVRTLEALLGGPREVATPTSDALMTNFGLSTIIGKALAVVQDANFTGRGGSVVVERLKTLTGGDTVQIDRKNRDPWVGRPSARWMLVSNEILGLVDPSRALLRRILGPIETVYEHSDEEIDVHLDEVLAGEACSILSWALDGYDRVRESGQFTEPRTARSVRAEIAQAMSPVTGFVDDVVETIGCPKTEDCPKTPATVVYARYRAWCEDTGHLAMNAPKFGRDLKSATGIERWQVRIDGLRTWVYPLALRRPEPL
jgi:putative DNA primase/helicase